MSQTNDRKTLAAMRAARKFIASSRLSVIESHAMPPRFRLESITDEGTLEWIAEHDELIAKLDAAIKRTA